MGSREPADLSCAVQSDTIQQFEGVRSISAAAGALS